MCLITQTSDVPRVTPGYFGVKQKRVAYDKKDG
jgi:hypothetical protein